MSATPITKQEAIAAVRAAAVVVDDGERTIVHSFNHGPMRLGADWDLDGVIEFIEAVDDSDPEHPQIGWVPDTLGHDLMVISPQGRVMLFDVKAPTNSG